MKRAFPYKCLSYMHQVLLWVVMVACFSAFGTLLLRSHAQHIGAIMECEFVLTFLKKGEQIENFYSFQLFMMSCGLQKVFIKILWNENFQEFAQFWSNIIMVSRYLLTLTTQIFCRCRKHFLRIDVSWIKVSTTITNNNNLCDECNR